MTGAPGMGEEQEEHGPLVFQRGKKLNDEYYIISVRDNREAASVRFVAYELESSETFDLSYSYADFDTLFKSHSQLFNPANKEGRYDWVIDRLDFTSESNGAVRRLTLGNEPTVEDEGPETQKQGGPKAIGKDRLSYAERTRLRQDAEKLEEKRTANIMVKNERNRKAFMAELQEKRKLEELKVASRRQRIEDERAERREQAAIQRNLKEELRKRYAENDQKREERIGSLTTERNARDFAKIREIVETAAQKREAREKNLQDARSRKAEQEAVQSAELVAKREADQKVEAKRDAKIGERNERCRQAELEYLALRKRSIDKIEQEKKEKEDRKQEYLKNKAMERATTLRAKHEKIEAWERTEDARTGSNMKKEHARNMLMLDHIESLRQEFQNQQAEATARKNASLEQRKQREAQEAEALAEENRQKAALEEKRTGNIGALEVERSKKNQEYCAKIRDLNTKHALMLRAQHEQVQTAREKNRESKMLETQCRREQDLAAATINARREENIRKTEQLRDQKFAQQVQERKEKEAKRAAEAEARRQQRRQAEQELAEKQRQEEAQYAGQAALLEEQRERVIRERALERNKREKERLRGARGAAEASAPQATAPEAAAEAVPA